MAMDNEPESHDVIILGAGLSGINSAHIFRQSFPGREFTVLEARSAIGGTWSFFKYPGFRTDSEMTVFGLKWYPWPHAHKVGSGPEIMEYLEEAVDKAQLRDNIRLRNKVLACEWKSEQQKWTLDVDADGERILMTANFVICCTGYYSYSRALPADIPGLDDFGGQVVHPQWWPEDLDYSGKRIVVVGSGATAITIVPPLAKTAANVTMLQRSPSYVVSIPMTSGVDNFIRMLLPLVWAQWLLGVKDTAMESILVSIILAFPALGKRLIARDARQMLPHDVDVNIHFNPRYNPFQQRIGMTPDGEFFKTLHQDNCEIVTDVIKTVTKDSILLESGREIPVDIIVTATGLYFELMGGMTPLVDGTPLDAGSQYAWRGSMVESLPNMAFVMGYTTTTWTPGADIVAKMLMRVLKHMEKKGATQVVPVMEHKEGEPRKLPVSATSSYFLKAADRMPKATGIAPWYGRTNLVVDIFAWMFSSMEDGLQYSRIDDPTKKHK